MASLNQPAARASKKPRARKLNLRLDMTPMVDLAFLLLTFFMLTTTFAKPRVMQLQMPVHDPEHPSDVMERRAMTVIVGRQHRVFYYFGLSRPTDPSVPVPTLHTTDFSAHGLRQALLLARQHQPELVVLLKANPAASYQDMVNLLDEMTLTNQPKYALTVLTAADRALLPPAERF